MLSVAADSGPSAGGKCYQLLTLVPCPAEKCYQLLTLVPCSAEKCYQLLTLVPRQAVNASVKATGRPLSGKLITAADEPN